MTQPMSAAGTAAATHHRPASRLSLALARLPKWHIGILVLFGVILVLAVVGERHEARGEVQVLAHCRSRLW